MKVPVRVRAGIKAWIRRIGFELVRPRSDAWLRTLPVRTIIDVGANIGQFATQARAQFPEAHIYAFEPLPGCFQLLTQRFAADKHFDAFRLALGREETTLVIHENEYSPSSSLLELMSLHRENFPYAARQSETAVQVRRLDDVLAPFTLVSDVLLKLDVQGYEDRVLDGAPAVLRQCAIVIAEVSFETLYREQALFDDIYRRLRSAGFRYHGNVEQLVSPRDGRILQADAIFMRATG